MDRRAFNRIAVSAALGAAVQCDATRAATRFALMLAQKPAAADAIYFALSLQTVSPAVSDRILIDRYGIPFFESALPLKEGGSANVDLGGVALDQIFLLGMVNSGKPRAWSDPLDYSKRYFIGDELGAIRVEYADGVDQVFPLILGDSLWWGELFRDNPDPFPSDTHLQKALAQSLRLYPAAPVSDGNYVAVIRPRRATVRRIVVQDASAKTGTPVITAITVQPSAGGSIDGAITAPRHALSPELLNFAQERALQPRGAADPQPLETLRRALYTSDENFRGLVSAELPAGYSGPRVSFQGNIFAEILSNAFHHNVADMLAKVTEDGVYHTSTRGAVSWGGYNGFGTYRENAGPYYDQSYARDLGRSLQELTALGHLDKAASCASFCLHVARLWEEKPSLKINGTVIPRHWCRIINRPGVGGCFENDGHGLISVFMYRLWQRLPDRDAWLRAHWTDVQAAGDWILWQFDHPELSRATEVLYTTGESANFGGNTVYADAVCMHALEGLAEMADSIGEQSSSQRWRERAQKMRVAISARYVVADAKYGRVWTLESAGWSNKSTVLGPLIFVADTRGLAPQDDDAEWRSVNQAAYQRLIDTYRPFGFYGTAMGYGQGFVTQSALLLDRMHDATEMLAWMAREIYDPRIGSFLVPEGVEIDPTGRYWYRIGDLGNGVQEAEVVKAMRILVGIDDTQPARMRVMPRMPFGWSRIEVDDFPVVFERANKTGHALLRYTLVRSADAMAIDLSADKDLGPVSVRLGPFEKRPRASAIRVNGAARDCSIEHSGDSCWAHCTVAISAEAHTTGSAKA